MLLPIVASTSSRTTRRLPLRRRPNHQGHPKSPVAREHESVSPIYSAASGKFAPDGRHFPGRYRRLFATSGFGVTGGRLSNDSSRDVLSGGQSERRGNDGEGSAGAGFWPNAGI